MRRFAFAVLAQTFLLGPRLLPFVACAVWTIWNALGRPPRRPSIVRQVALGGLVFLLSAESTAVAQLSYRFSKIADSTGRYAALGHAPVINQHGVVAFVGRTKDRLEIITFGNDITTVVADTSGELADFGPVALNDNDSVAFYGRFDDGRRGIFKISGGAVTNITITGPLECCSRFSPNVHINNAGTVVFQASLSPVESAIYTGRGGPLTTIAKSGEEFRLFGGSPWISEHGQVVFSAYAADRRQAVYLANDSSIAKLMEVNGYPYTFPSMSSSGEITFFSDFADTLGRVITRITGGVATTLVSVAGPFERLYVPSTTPGGRYAFMGGLDLGGFGIFTGPDPVKDKVIRTGDPLFGSTVFEVGFYRGLNDRGDVAFRYRLVNGVEGVAMARIVPEPAGLAMVIAALVIVVLRAPGPRRPGSLRDD